MVESPGSGDRSQRVSAQLERERRGLRRSLTLTTLGTLIPGAGLTRTRHRLLGSVMVIGFVVALLGVIVALLVKGPTSVALWLAARPSLVRDLGIAALVLGAVWCITIVMTAWLTRPARLSPGRSALHAGLTAVLVLVIAIPAWWVQGNARLTNSTLNTVLQGSAGDDDGLAIAGREDPWAGIPRVNVLLIGSDAGDDRIGTRTDSLIVASIDTASGDTVMFGIPRNLERVPFPAKDPLHAQFPRGYYCPERNVQFGPGNECMINAIWSEVVGDDSANPAKIKQARATLKGVVGEVLGLRIDYSVMVDLKGFQQLVDAMGGIDMNVKLDPNNPWGWTAIPIGAHWNANQTYPIDVPKKSDTRMWIPTGHQHLDGFQALWYARSRVIDAEGDFNRMVRQRCVASAIVKQAKPTVLLGQYQQILAAAGDNISSDIAVDELPAFVTLVERIQKAKITSLPFTPQLVNVARPDFDAMHAMVQRALHPPTPSSVSSTTTTTTSPSHSATTPSGGKSSRTTKTPTPVPTNSATAPVSVDEAC